MTISVSWLVIKASISTKRLYMPSERKITTVLFILSKAIINLIFSKSISLEINLIYKIACSK